MPAPINLADFSVNKIGNVDIERNYINDILHAIVAVTDNLQTEIDALSGGGSIGDQGSFIVAQQETSLPNSRQLFGETGVIEIVDGGAGTAITVGIADGGVSNTKLANMPDQTFKGNDSGGTSAPQDLTMTQATAMLNQFGTLLQGVVPGPGLAISDGFHYIDATGTWSIPPAIYTINTISPDGAGDFTIESTDLSVTITPTTNGIDLSAAAGSGTVNSVVGGTGIDVDSTDPANPIVSLEDTAVTPGTYGDSTHVMVGVVDQQGRLTGVTNVAIAFPAGASGANPTASVGLSVVNGSAGTFMRSDAAPPLSQSIVPTWTGVHTFTPQAVFTGGLITGGSVDIQTDVRAGSGNITAGSLGHGRAIGNLTDFGGGDVIFMGMIGDADPPTIGRVFADPGSGKIDAIKILLSNGAVTMPTSLALSGVISPTAISGSGTTNDWNPGLAGALSVVRQSITGITPAARTFTGLVAGTDGQLVIIVNIGTSGHNIVLSAENTGSSAANRFGFQQDITLHSEDAVTLWYDATSSRWRLLQIMTDTTPFALISKLEVFNAGAGQTWTRATGAKTVRVYTLAAGGGGGGGLVAGGNTRLGAAGGGGGAGFWTEFSAASLGASETINVGAGGTGGAPVAGTGPSNGGNAGGDTSFGAWITAYGGGGGGGATGGAGAGGGGGGAGSAGGNGQGVSIGTAGLLFGVATTNTAGLNFNTTAIGGAAGANGSSNAVGLTGGSAASGGPGGGSGGGTATARVGGTGGSSITSVTGGSPGASTSGSANGGNGATPHPWYPGSGGGGGGSPSTVTATAGNGGTGGRGAGGGGAGSCGASGTAGTGGTGGDGICVVITYF